MLKENATIKINYKNKIDGIELLKQIESESLKVVFFDPQYRGVLDKLSYGNEGKQRGIERSNLSQMTEPIIINFLKEINRVLTKDGYIFLWVDKFHLVEGIKPWIAQLKDVAPVDLITWDKQKIGMGYRTRRKAEYLLVLQKKPRHAASTWTKHDIPDVWSEKIINKTHTHTKPVDLQKALIEATTNKGDFVCDPASGSYSVFKACLELKRNFIGGDIEFGEE